MLPLKFMMQYFAAYIEEGITEGRRRVTVHEGVVCTAACARVALICMQVSSSEERAGWHEFLCDAFLLSLYDVFILHTAHLVMSTGILIGGMSRLFIGEIHGESAMQKRAAPSPTSTPAILHTKKMSGIDGQVAHCHPLAIDWSRQERLLESSILTRTGMLQAEKRVHDRGALAEAANAVKGTISPNDLFEVLDGLVPLRLSIHRRSLRLCSACTRQV